LIFQIGRHWMPVGKPSRRPSRAEIKWDIYFFSW